MEGEAEENISSNILNDLVEKRLKEAQARKEFKDEGRVAGTAKERRAITAITSANLHIIEQDEIAAQRTIVKAKIWPAVDIDAEKAAGISSGAVYLKVELQKALAAAPYNSKEGRSIYVKVLEVFKELLKQCVNVDEVIATSRALFYSNTDKIIAIAPEIENADISAKGKKSSSAWRSYYSTTRQKIELVFGKRFVNLAAFSSKDRDKIDNALNYSAQSKEAADMAYKRAVEVNTIQAEKTKKELQEITGLEGQALVEKIQRYGMPVSVRSDGVTIQKYEDIVATSLTKRLAILEANIANPPVPDYLKEHPETWEWAYGKKEKKEVKQAEHKINTYPYLSHIIRKGGVDTDSIGVSTQAIKEYWGLKAVQYGNSLSDSESKKLAKYANGSFMDLEEITKIDIAALNKINELTLDFATRGTAGSAATYWPDYKVINLNKRNGDGSLAHEFGHYLDNLLAKKAGTDKVKINGHLGHMATRSGAANPAIDGIIKSLMSYITNGNGTETLTITIPAKKSTYNLYKGPYQSWQECYEYYRKRYPNDFYLAKGGAAKVAHILALFNVEKAEVTLPVGSTIVWYNSFKIGGYKTKSYWIDPAELFARAWEVYVMQKLNYFDIQNTFLQQARDYFGKVTPYAEGAEADIIVGHFDKLVQAIISVYNIPTTKDFSGPRVDYNEVNTTLGNTKPEKTEPAAKPADAEPVKQPEPTPAPMPQQNDTPTVEAGVVNYTWESLPDFAKVVSKPGTVKWKPSPTDKGLLALLKPFTVKDEKYNLRPLLTGIYFDEEEITATDSHVMVTLPNTGEVRGVYKNGIKLDGKYPNYKAVIPSPYDESGYKAENVDLLKLKTYCQAALFISNPVTKQVVFPFGPYTGHGAAKFGFNGEYLIECCEFFLKLGINSATFKYKEPNKPLIIIPNGPHKFITELALCMPVMISDKKEIGYGAEDFDYKIKLSTAYDLHTNNLINPDGSVAKFNADLKAKNAKQGNVDYNMLQLIKKVTPKNGAIPVVEYAAIIKNTIYCSNLRNWIIVENAGLADGLYSVKSGGLFISPDDLDEYPLPKDITNAKPFGIVSSTALEKAIEKGKEKVKSNDNFFSGAVGLRADGNKLFVQTEENFCSFEEAEANIYAGVIIQEHRPFENFIKSIPEQPLEIYLTYDKIIVKAKGAEFISSDVKLYTKEGQKKAKELNAEAAEVKEQTPAPTAPKVEPTREPTPEPVKTPAAEPTPAPAPAAEPPAEEKPKRQLSYLQQVTLLKGKLKAKGRKLTEAEVIAEGLKLHEARKQSAQTADEKRDGKKRLSPTTENLLRWAANPGDFELIGVDTFERTDPTADYQRTINKQKILNLYGIKA